MKKFLNKIDFLILILLFCVVFITYWLFPFTYYQQDEWVAVGQFLTGGILAQTSSVNPFLLILGSNRVLSHPFHMLFYGFFPLQIWPFVFFAFFFHTLNSYLVFLLTKKISKSLFIALVAGVFFAVCSTGNQGVTWAGALTTTLPAAFFTFFSLYLFLQYLDGYRQRNAYFAFILAIIAFLFKESSIFILFVFFVLYVKYANRKKIDLKIFSPFLIYFAVALIVRIIDMLTSTTNPVGKFGTDSSVFTKASYFIFIYPLSAIAQYFVPLKEMFKFAFKFEQVNYPFILSTSYAGLVSERIVGELLSIIISFCILIFFVIAWFRDRKYRKVMVFAFTLLILSIFPFIIIERGNAYLESRYYYVGTAGAGILLGILSVTVFSELKKVKEIPYSISISIVGLVLFTIFTLQIKSVYRDLDLQVKLADTRKSFIKELKEMQIVLPDNPVFYITGDQKYYGYNHYVPFQQGLGYTLMILYFDTKKISSELVKENYLWDVGSQGYKEKGGRGFGYFADKEAIFDAVKNKKIMPKQIITLEYNSKEKILFNKTIEFRKELDTRFHD